MMPEPIEFTLSNGNVVRILYDPANKVKDETKNNIVGRILKQIQKKLRFKLVGRKLFNIKAGTHIKEFEVWPGY